MPACPSQIRGRNHAGRYVIVIRNVRMYYYTVLISRSQHHGAARRGDDRICQQQGFGDRAWLGAPEPGTRISVFVRTLASLGFLYAWALW